MFLIYNCNSLLIQVCQFNWKVRRKSGVLPSAAKSSWPWAGFCPSSHPPPSSCFSPSGKSGKKHFRWNKIFLKFQPDFFLNSIPRSWSTNVDGVVKHTFCTFYERIFCQARFLPNTLYPGRETFIWLLVLDTVLTTAGIEPSAASKPLIQFAIASRAKKLCS